MVAIEQIRQLLEQLHGDAGKKSSYNFIEVCCTNSTILAFDRSQIFPKYVVRVGDEVSLRRYWEKLTALNQLLPQIIPAAVCLSQVAESQWALVQAGVPGTPWFTLSSRTKNTKESQRLITRSLDVLRTFHAAVNTQPGWSVDLTVVDAFESDLEKNYAGGIVFPVSAMDQISNARVSLREFDTLSCHWQHGDFCFNNLMFHGDATYLIDFDDFGKSALPLLDQIGLAFSIAERIPGRSFWGTLKTAVSQSQYPDLDDCRLRTLVVCHLVNVMAETISVERRQLRQKQLLNTIAELPAVFS